jgi:dihydrofolate synthase/folylpolyglutamate synthase
MKTLPEWLEHCERLHPEGIEMGLERVRAVAERLALRFACPVITVAGTNGKGSTCAMLEAILLQAGYRTGVYTSPHLVHFEERCRIHGEIARAPDLIPHFERVEQARGDTSLTYFEFTTLAILSLMATSGLDVAVLEVGLGGRLDAVNVIDTDCAIITSIDIDHAELLGDNRESIGYEKAGILRTGKPAIVSDPMPPQSVIDRATEIDAPLWRFGHDFNFSGDRQQWAWAGRGRRFAGLAYPALRGANQLVNASGVLAALEALREKLPVAAQAVRNGLAMVELPGRFPDRARPADPGAGRFAQPAFGVGPDRQPGCDGLLPDHPCRIRCDGRQRPGAHAGARRRAGGPLVFHRSAHAARGASPGFAGRLAGAAGAPRGAGQCACVADGGPARRHRRGRPR